MRFAAGAWRRAAGFALLLVLALPAQADIAGRVVDDPSGEPIADALVSLRARPDIAPVRTAADGSFVLPLQLEGIFEVAAAVDYSPTAPRNWFSDTQQAFDGLTGIELRLGRLSTVDNPDYQPPAADAFCIACHSSYYQEWSTARHAGAARNPWVLDLFSGDGTPGGGAGYVFRDSHDAGETGFCATCHAPLQDVFTPGQLMLDETSTPGGLDGVTCLACHQIAHVNSNVDALHHLGNASYRFPLDDPQTAFHVFGALPDVDRIPMQNVYQPQFKDSRLCASCHEYKNPDTGAPGQATYSEWLASPYAQPGPGYRSCQDCHMPARANAGSIGAGGPQRPASQRHSHAFVGSTPATLAANTDLRITLVREATALRVRAEVENRAGHAFPTGISIRNALLLLDVRVGGQPLPQLSGSTLPFWASDDVPGEQPGDYAGRPGKGFAKVLEGRINGQGATVRPVLFIDAEGVTADTAIPSGAVDASEYRFALPPGTTESTTVSIDAQLLYRRAWRALAVTKGWTQTPSGMPVEIPVQRIQQSRTLGSLGPPPAPPIAIPVGERLPLWLALALLGGLVAWRFGAAAPRG